MALSQMAEHAAAYLMIWVSVSAVLGRFFTTLIEPHRIARRLAERFMSSPPICAAMATASARTTPAKTISTALST
jgi:hypothetical protein